MVTAHRVTVVATALNKLQLRISSVTQS